MSGTMQDERRRTKRRSLAIWGGGAFLLAAPLAAMQFTEGMQWTAFDFALVGGLLAAACLGLELALRRTGNPAYSAAAGVALVTAAMLVLANGAVGFIGSEDEPANLVYVAVLAIALLWSVVARFRPAGMARAMLAAAGAQALAPALAAGIWPAARSQAVSATVLAVTAVFAGLWLLSAWLFRRAAFRS
jgi:hypothetical protein